ncbi:hypothetical protein M2267_001393 [Ensifer sp. KUDG1]|uniref:hypothetical protein n=1 Tax=unclassified Ensifer TaxID=2633371 RepID=UPI0005B7D612|nr:MULTISPECIES: hypothetical protein [unclassified Ensifer]MBD9647677.1 hypothetical protein [Ensifer sp. ENS09]QRY68484.1 hypothetical protein JVX98_09465 [Ensifer sp. PDNC004]
MTPHQGANSKPAKTSASDRAAATDHTARAIVAAEKLARDRKTEKLKAQRLERAAAEPAVDAAPSKPPRKSQRV